MNDLIIKHHGAMYTREGCHLTSANETFKNLHVIYTCGSKDCLHRGTVRWLGSLNSNDVMGIEFDHSVPFGTNGTFGGKTLFTCNSMCGIIVKNVEHLEVDKDYGFIIVKSAIDMSQEDGQFCLENIVTVKVNLDSKYLVGKVLRSGRIKNIFCYEIDFGKKNIPNTSIVACDRVMDKFLDDNGFVMANSHVFIHSRKIHQYSMGDYVCVSMENGSSICSSVVWTGTINDEDCIALKEDKYCEYVDDFRILLKDIGFCIMVCLKFSDVTKLPQPSNNYQAKPGSSLEKVESDTSTQLDAIMPLYCFDQKFLLNSNSNSNTENFLISAIFSMFTFTELFDYLLMPDECVNDTTKRSIRNKLWEKFVLPIRRNESVSATNDDFLSQNFCDNYIHKSSTSVLEYLLKLSETPLFSSDISLKEYIIKVKPKQDQKKITILQSLMLKFLDTKTFLNYPPKGLILHLENYSSSLMTIMQKMEISKFINSYRQKCSACTQDANELCVECSNEKLDLIFYCHEHKMNCNHGKELWKASWKSLFDEKVELDIFSVLASETDDPNNVIAYVKTAEFGDKWLRFHSSNFEITQLNNIFESNQYKDIENRDVFCFYKNPVMEFYWDTFNEK